MNKIIVFILYASAVTSNRWINEGKVFGSITGKSIANRLIKLGYQIDKKSIDLPRPINTLGDFKIKIKLYTSIYAEVSVVIKKEEN